MGLSVQRSFNLEVFLLGRKITYTLLLGNHCYSRVSHDLIFCSRNRPAVFAEPPLAGEQQRCFLSATKTLFAGLSNKGIVRETRSYFGNNLIEQRASSGNI